MSAVLHEPMFCGDVLPNDDLVRISGVADALNERQPLGVAVPVRSVAGDSESYYTSPTLIGVGHQHSICDYTPFKEISVVRIVNKDILESDK